MKSTASKKNEWNLTRSYLALFGVLFVGALVMFVDHFTEDPLDTEELRQSQPQAINEVKAEVGYIAPDFALRNLDGNRVRLSDFKGQLVVLNLWATWCVPCRVEMPSIEHLYRRFRSQGLTVLAVSLDKGNEKEVREFVDEYQLSFPVLIDEKEEVESKYQSFSIPVTYVIDQRGRVVAKVLDAKNWESEETFKAIELLLSKA